MTCWTKIELVFDRLKQYNLKIKPKKFQFFDTSVLFLGHILSAKGISANPEKIEKVKTWPVPKNIKEVQSFLGLASYYRQFIDKFAKKAQCLHKLVGPKSYKHRKAKAKREKDNPTTVTQSEPRIFEWTMKHQEAVTEKFRDYLLGLQFQVYTDNNPLAYVMESKLGASQIQWVSKLALFNFVIKYQTGRSNRATDALSCHLFNPTCDDSFTESEANSDECEVISYSSVCEAVDLCLNSMKIPKDLMQGVQRY